jgi:two-component system, NarL family, sensor histidine kinase UhpB
MAKVPDFRENSSRIRCTDDNEREEGEPDMPLRLRLITLVGLVLLASLACGGGLVAWHAAISVRTELRAALDVGANTIRNGFSDMSGDEDRAVNLRHLVATFDGNRHIRATLLDAADRPLASSRLFAPTQGVPEWFRRLIAVDLATVRLPVPRADDRADDDPGAVVLRADPINEIGEVWGQSRDAVLVLAVFGLLSALLISVAVRGALRPLERLSAAFERIGEDNY